ncbi:MAG: hypothetical protein QOF98_1088 [Streptomyces sp.]|nr:hypothetical protein [Streptomyces sp.]
MNDNRRAGRRSRGPAESYTRITYPMVRGTDGALRRAGWDEALDRAHVQNGG